MRRRAVIGFATLLLGACADSGADNSYVNMTRPELLAQLQLGRSVLRCREACLSAWRDTQPRAAQLDASSQWGDLAAVVMHTGYQDDLSLYYLGRAAEGMGFYAAAVGYYRQSTELSGTSISCTNLSRLCGGLTLPADAARRRTIVQDLMTKPVPRRRPEGPRPPGTPATTAPETTPPPTATPAAMEQVPAPALNPTGDSDNKTPTTPAVSAPTPVPAPFNPKPDSGYVEPAPGSGYLEPPARAR
jgi:hypothetical protein